MPAGGYGSSPEELPMTPIDPDPEIPPVPPAGTVHTGTVETVVVRDSRRQRTGDRDADLAAGLTGIDPFGNLTGVSLRTA